MDGAEPSPPSDSVETLDAIAGQVLAMALEKSLSPAMVLVLIRNYLATGRHDVAAGLSAALTTALEHRPSGTLSDDRPAWLLVFLEAANVSDDERVGEEAAALTMALRSEWPGRGPMPPAMRSLTSCLAAVLLMRQVAAQPADDGLLAAAIDELERIVGRAYEPGEGLLAPPGHDVPGTLEDHVTTAAALLAAYRATGRLPYSMLAEELMRVARRRWWSEAEGRFVDPREREAGGEILIVNCEAARVLAQLSTLHADADYQKAVVVADTAPTVTNFEDADRVLAWLGRSCPVDGPARAEYAIALGERLSLR